MYAPQLIRFGVANDTGRLRPTLQHTLEAALSISGDMIDELMQRLAPVLDLGRAGALPAGAELLDVVAVEHLVARADLIKRDWQHQLREVLYHGHSDDGRLQGSVRFDDLRLMDERQINASIEFASAEHGLQAPTADLLPRLNALVSNLMGWLSVQPELNPLRPRAYALALRAVLQQHLPDAAQRSAVAIPVANIMGESLRQVYRELIQWLQAHGVEPLQVSSGRAVAEQPPSAALGRTLLTLGRLRQLLAGDLNAPADGAAHYLHTVPASMAALEDLDLIEPLLQRLRQRPLPAPAVAAPELPVVNGQQLGRLLGQEVVRLMLEHLTHDERLLPAIRQQLARLEPALVRLSQAEPRFFSDRLHPARQLLETLTQRSLGYQSHADEGFDALIGSIQAAVRSLQRVEASEAVYARLLRRLRRRWAQDEARKRQRHADATRALLHAEQRQTLAERLAQDFAQRLHGLDVPVFVQHFLQGPWAQAVAEWQLQAPADAPETDLAALTDELIWSVQPSLIRRDVDRLGRLLPRLVPQLRAGLQGIGYPAERTVQFLDALVALHQKALDLPTLTVAPDSAPPASASPALATPSDSDPAMAPPEVANGPNAAVAGPPDTFWIAGQDAEDAGFLSGASGPMPLEPLGSVAPLALATGAWVDLRVKGAWVRAQLTWTSPRGGLYMFISTQGLAHSMTQRTLDRLLAQDALRIVASGGLLDNALDAVALQALHNACQAPSGDN